MKTLLLEIDETIYSQVINFLRLLPEKQYHVLGPVVYAFWTTSDLHIHAKEFSRKMGIWHLDGMALAEYVLKLKLVNEIFPEDEHLD